MPIEFDGPNSKVSANTIQAQSGSTVTIQSGHNLSGGGSGLTGLNATNLGSGTVPTARLGSGTANNGVFLRGDGTWAAAGGVDGITSSADATAISIDANEIVTMPKQPSFSVKLSADQNNIAVGSNQTILFNSEVFDQNADFNTSTYTFTAPATGRYQFNLNLANFEIDSANTEYTNASIITSNRSYSSFFDTQQQLNADCYYFYINLSILADMDANDTAYATVKQHNGTQQQDINSYHTYFSGYLAC